MVPYQRGEARKALEQLFLNTHSRSQVHIEAAKTLAIVDAIEDLEGHLTEQIFWGPTKRT